MISKNNQIESFCPFCDSGDIKKIGNVNSYRGSCKKCFKTWNWKRQTSFVRLIPSKSAKKATKATSDRKRYDAYELPGFEKGTIEYKRERNRVWTLNQKLKASRAIDINKVWSSMSWFKSNHGWSSYEGGCVICDKGGLT